METTTKLLIEIILALIFIALIILFILNFSELTSLQSIRDLFNKLKP